MKPQDIQLLRGLLINLDSVLERESMYFAKERPFLFTGGKAMIVPLSPDDQKKMDRLELERVMITRELGKFQEKHFPALPPKQEPLC